MSIGQSVRAGDSLVLWRGKGWPPRGFWVSGWLLGLRVVSVWVILRRHQEGGGRAPGGQRQRVLNTHTQACCLLGAPRSRLNWVRALLSRMRWDSRKGAELASICFSGTVSSPLLQTWSWGNPGCPSLRFRVCSLRVPVL